MEVTDGVNPILEVHDLRLRRGDRPILSGTTFSLQRGGVVALMGPSGSGKTTVLRAIAGLERFEAGTIVLDGLMLSPGPRHATDVLRKLRRQVGLVFQFHHLFEHLSALRNITLAPMHVLGVPSSAAERRARELLEALGIAHQGPDL